MTKEDQSIFATLRDIALVIVLLFILGMSFGYGVTQMVEAKTYIIEVHDTTQPDEVE